MKASQELKKDGIDVIIGYLEPHERPDTMKMAEGLETLPLKQISYKGITLKEFDVELTPKKPPPLVKNCLMIIWLAAGPRCKLEYSPLKPMYVLLLLIWKTELRQAQLVL